MIPFYHPKQVEKIVKFNGDHKYDLQKGIYTLNESHLTSILFKIEIDEITDFLNHHYEDCEFKTVLINMLFSYSFKNLVTEKQEKVIDWIEDKTNLGWKFVKECKQYFRISTDRSKPFEINYWTNELSEFSLGKDTKEILKFLEYGMKMLNEEHQLHTIICRNKYECNFCDQLTTKKERTNLFYAKVEDYQQSQNQSKPQSEIENKIQWKGTQKQLAELFIELKKNNWIEDFEYDTIKSCFSNSNTIQQVLKPSRDTKTGTNDYEQVYTALYEPQFHGILKNKKPS